MRRFAFLAALAAAGSWVVHAQTCTPSSAPCISSLQSDFVTSVTPTRGAAITAGTPIADFWLFIKGNFFVGAGQTVTWTGIGAPSGQTLQVVSANGTQIIADVPSTLFASAGTASVTVTQVSSTSSGSTYTVNPPLAALTLPSGTAGVAYAQPLASGGTANFSISSDGGTLPPGMAGPYQPGPSQQPNTSFAGVPTAIGTYTFGMFITDAWNNSLTGNYSLTIFPASLPVITSLSQTSAPVGSCTIFTINGQNFANGYTAVFVNGTALTALPTTFVSATQLTATLPSSPTTPGTYAIEVEVGGSFNSPPVSNAVPFTLLAPTITGLVRSFGTVGAALGTQLTVNGSNFAALNSTSCLMPGSIVEFGSKPQPTAFVNGNQLTATLPALTSTGIVPVNVLNLTTSSNSLNFTVNPAPSITSVSPTFCTVSTSAAGCGALSLQISGANFFGGAAIVNGVPNNQEAILWDGTQIGFGTVNSTSSITASIPPAILTPGAHQVWVVTFDGVASNHVAFGVNPAPILTGAQPNSVSPSTAFTLTLTGSNFLPGMKVQWQGPSGSAALTPSSLASTQIVVAVPQNLTTSGGTATVAVQTADPIPVLSNALSITIAIQRQPLVITTASPLTPPATVGVYYSNVFAATGGDQSAYTFSTAGGALPSGMDLHEDGLLVGTASAAGTFTFTVQVADASGNTATKGFTLVVNPPALTITTPPFSSMQAGSAVNTTFTAKGGTPPYTFAESGTLPPGTQFSGATLAGTVTTPGTYSFTVTATDSAQGTASQGYTITVTGTALSITTTSPLGSGQVGVAYSPGVQFQATGGTTPYTWAATSLPPGMTFSTGGVLSGTPTKAGTFSIGVIVTDSAKTSARGTFAITIAALAITTASLPDATVGTAYGGTMTASGGVTPLTWTASGLPAGISLSSSGSFSGTPTTAGASSVSVSVSDAAGNSDSKSYTLTVNVSPLKIAPSGTVPASTVGSGFSLGFTVTGGTGPYSFAATGLPGGLSISSSTGAISGSPTAAGSFNVTVTATDSTGATANTSFTISVALPPTPPVNFTGISTTVNPGSQSSVGVGLGSPYPVAITVKLTLSFSGTDPAVQFATGGTTATITIPAGQTAGATTVGVQTGTVAGTITITAQLTAGTQDVTPSPTPKTTISVPATAPVISSITATRTGSGFTVTIVGYSSTRTLTTANFQFNGTNLATTNLSLPVDAIFSPWYQGSASNQFGSNFTYTQPFTTANPAAVTSVTVTLVNSTGTSSGATANLQ